MKVLELVQRAISTRLFFLDEDVYTNVSYTANKNLHEVNPDPPLLPKNNVEDFYSIVAKLYGKINEHR